MNVLPPTNYSWHKISFRAFPGKPIDCELKEKITDSLLAIAKKHVQNMNRNTHYFWKSPKCSYILCQRNGYNTPAMDLILESSADTFFDYCDEDIYILTNEIVSLYSNIVSVLKNIGWDIQFRWTSTKETSTYIKQDDYAVINSETKRKTTRIVVERNRK